MRLRDYWVTVLFLGAFSSPLRAALADPVHGAIRAIVEGRAEEAWKLAADIRFSESDSPRVKRLAARRANLAARIADEYSTSRWMRTTRRYSSPDGLVELAGVALLAYPLEPDYWRDFAAIVDRQGGLSRRSAAWLSSSNIPFTTADERRFLVDIISSARSDQSELAAAKLEEWIGDQRNRTGCVSRILLAEIEISRQHVSRAYELTRDRDECPAASTRIGRVAEAMHTQRSDWEYYEAWFEDDPHDVSARQVAISLLANDLLRSRARDSADHEWDIVAVVLRAPASIESWRLLWADAINRQSFATMEKVLDHEAPSGRISVARRSEREVATARLARGILELSRANPSAAMEAFRAAVRGLPESAECVSGLVLASAWLHQEQGRAHLKALQTLDPQLANAIDPEHFERCVNGAIECRVGSILRLRSETIAFLAFEAGLEKENAGRDEIAKLQAEMNSVQKAVDNLLAQQGRSDARIEDLSADLAGRMQQLDATIREVTQQLEEVHTSSKRIDERIEGLRREFQRPGQQMDAVNKRFEDLREAVSLLELQVRMNDEYYAKLAMRVDAAEAAIRNDANVRDLLARRHLQIEAAFADLAQKIRQIPVSDREMLQDALETISRWTDDIAASVNALGKILRHVGSAEIPLGRFITIDVVRLLDLFDLNRPDQP